MKIPLIFIASLMTRIVTSMAQTSIHEYSIDEGLPQLVVNCIAEDKLGYLWIGTEGGGLAKFDGSRFEVYGVEHGISSTTIYDVAIGEDNFLWIANAKGIMKYDGERFSNFIIGTENSSRSIFLAGDSLLFFNRKDKTIGVIVQDSVQQLPLSHPLNDASFFLKIGNSHLLSVSTQSRLVVLYYQGRYRSIPYPSDVGIINSFYREGADLMISTAAGLFQVRNDSLVKRSLVVDDVVLYDSVRSRYWARRGKDMVAVTHPSKKKADVTISNVTARCTFQDKEGNIWLGTAGKGLIKVSDYIFLPAVPSMKTMTDRDGVMAILPNVRNELWAGYISSGLRVYDSRDVQKMILKKDFTFSFTIREDAHHQEWIGTKEGLYSFKNGEFVNHYSEVTNILSFDFGKDGEMVVATQLRELFYITGNKCNRIDTALFIVRDVRYNPDTHEFLLATTSGMKRVVDGKLVGNDFPQYEINSVGYFPNGTEVAGSLESGIFLKKGNIIRHLTVADGLLSNQSYFVIPDGKYLWVGQERGINRLEVSEQMKVKEIIEFGKQHGLEGMECNRNAFYLTDTTLYVGLVSGAYKLFKKNAERKHLFPLHLRKLALQSSSGGPVVNLINQLNGRAIQPVSELQYNENNLFLEVNQVDKQYPGLYYYSVRLSGPMNLVSAPSKKGIYEYTNLTPGRYLLEVTATDASGNKVYGRINKRFYIRPAIYQRLWFVVLAVLSGISVVLVFAYLLYRQRVRRMVRLQELQTQQESKLRNEISRDFHDELGNQVARLINTIGMLRLSKKLDEDIFKSLSGYSQRILLGAKDFVWTLDPVNDELGNVIIHLRDFGERMFSEQDINFRFESNVIPGISLPTGFNRQINLIFKEAMTNTYKHSRATLVTFGVKQQSSLIEIYLNDNGVGIAKEILDKSERGLSNMSFRARKIKANLDIISDKKGTIIALHLDL